LELSHGLHSFSRASLPICLSIGCAIFWKNGSQINEQVISYAADAKTTQQETAVKLKTVLVITYYWPPAGGPGVQRALKFCKYLPQFGWRPVVLTVADGEYPAIDESLAEGVDSDLTVYKTASLEPFAWYRRFTGKKTDEKISTFILTEDSQGGLKNRLAAFIRGNFFIPDGRIGWKPFAVKKGLEIIRQEKIDMIFSTAPPMSTHLIAKTLARKSGLPWVADFRDPWTDVFYYHNLKRSRPALSLDQRLERSVLRAADAVVTVSPTIKNLLQAKAKNEYFIIPNGYDAEDFDVALLPKDGYLHLLHAGHLAVNQNPVVFWRALRRLAETAEFSNLCIDYYGSIHSNVQRSLKDVGLAKFCRFFSYKPHNEIVAAMKRADLLFFIVPETSYAKGIPTSKLFDYIGAGKPILGIGPSDGDAADILRQTGAGVMAEAENETGLLNAIKQLFELPKNGQQKSNIGAYTREFLTMQLANIFKNFIKLKSEKMP
jgi:glycosyltransferase involved in cell wall biosynthesis